MTTVRKVKTKDSIAGFKDSKINCCISLSTGMGLYVNMLCTEKLLCPVDSKLFNDIHQLGIRVFSLSEIENTLETIYLDLIKESR